MPWRLCSIYGITRDATDQRINAFAMGRFQKSPQRQRLKVLDTWESRVPESVGYTQYVIGQHERRLIFTGYLLGLILSIAFSILTWILTGSPYAFIAAVVVAVVSAAGVAVVVVGMRFARHRRRYAREPRETRSPVEELKASMQKRGKGKNK